jgi:hypothetical protein
MIIILEESLGTTELVEQIITVYEVADYNIPGGISEGIFTGEGQLIVSLGSGLYPFALPAPSENGAALRSNLSVVGKMEWQGGGDLDALAPAFTGWRDKPNQQVNNASWFVTLRAMAAANRARGLPSGIMTTPTGTYPGTGAFFGGVLLPDGRVFCVPFLSTTARIYDPITDTLTTPTGTYPGTGAFAGGVLLQDGRVFCVPSYSTSARIYDQITDTLTTPTGTYPGTGAFFGGVLLPDGRVFCVPRSATRGAIANTRSHIWLDSNFTTSPFFNKL